MEATSTVTVKVKGEGGNVEETDVPAEGTPRREIFDGMLRKGWLTIVEGDYTPDSEPVDDAPKKTPAKKAAPAAAPAE